MQQRRSIPWLALLFLGPTSCGHGDGQALSPLLAQGSYALESVTGRGAASGTIVLSATGAVARRVRYSQATGSASQEYVALGTFRLHAGGVLELRLQEDSGRSAYVWQPSARLNGDVLELRYPDPADGPDIIEFYRRQ